ncbi:unnamed protein product [Paramecium primaurelia]|uniref:Uncharacterized protein n=1 Tax=Paramecium primaurelia TaxID=5886 RepID=A0A8S1N369_PARPR|nr:unnamed protein product [Paramecium primaurelia]
MEKILQTNKMKNLYMEPIRYGWHSLKAKKKWQLNSRIIQTKQFQIVVLKKNADLNLIYYNIIQGIIQFILGIRLLKKKNSFG